MEIDLFNDLLLFFDESQIKYKIDNQIIRLTDFDVSYYLVTDTNQLKVKDFENLRRLENEKHGSFLIFIWYDLWLIKKDIILSKIKHSVGQSKKLHARKTIVKSVNKKDCVLFFSNNHLNQPLIGFKRFGLYLNDELIALASFAKKRKFRDDSYSAEMLQFSTKNGIHINGGLSKLIKHFIRQYDVKTLMTYIDLDWANGDNFKTIGFESTDIKASIYFKLNQQNKRESTLHPTPIFNMGSVKSILTFDDYTVTNPSIHN